MCEVPSQLQGTKQFIPNGMGSFHADGHKIREEIVRAAASQVPSHIPLCPLPMPIPLVSSKLTFTDASVQTRGRIHPVNEDGILIVDASRLVRSVFSSTLSARYTCMTSASCDEAMQLIKALWFDIIIADVTLPGLTQIVHRYPDAIMILVSAVDDRQNAWRAARLGAFDYLIKPCDLNVLERVVGRAFEHRGLLRTRARRDQLARRGEATFEIEAIEC